MAIHPLNDRLKIKVDKDEFNLDSEKTLSETGIVEEVPNVLIYLSFHSFAFENSFSSKELDKIQKFYDDLKGKRVFWEKLQDAGRHMKEGNDEYVYLQMTDVLAYSDDIDVKAEMVGSVGSSNSFNLE